MAISLTKRAAEEVKKIMEAQSLAPETVLRTIIVGGGCSGMQYTLGFDTKFDPEIDAKYVSDGVPLVDFLYDAEKNEILFAMRELLSSGYRPVLAHVERYTNLKKKDVAALRDSGVMMQVNSASLLPGAPQGRTARAEKLLSAGLVDFVSSDTHDPHHRPPMMKKSYERIKKRYGSAYADAIFYRNAVKLLVG